MRWLPLVRGLGLVGALAASVLLFGQLQQANSGASAARSDLIILSTRVAQERSDREAVMAKLQSGQDLFKADLIKLGNDLSILGNELSAQQTGLSAATGDVVALKADTAAIQVDAIAVKKALGSTQGDLDSTKKTVNGLDTTLTTIRVSATVTSADVSAAKTNIANVQATATSIQSSVVSLQATAAANLGSVSALQASQRTADTRFRYQMAVDAYGLFWTAANSASSDVSNAVLALLDASVKAVGVASLNSSYNDWLTALSQLSQAPNSATARNNFTAKDDALMVLLFQGLNNVPK